MEINIQGLIEERRCFEIIRNLRWPQGVHCPHCESTNVIKKGQENYRQRYLCKGCTTKFDDLTNTVFSGHHQPLKTWVMFLYFLGLNLSTQQIAQELDLNKDDAQYMATILRAGIVEKKPEEKLDGIVELDEVYVVAGHKGNPKAVKKKGEEDEETA